MDTKDNDPSASHKLDRIYEKPASNRSSAAPSFRSEGRSPTPGRNREEDIEWNIELGYQMPPRDPEPPEVVPREASPAQRKRKRSGTPQSPSQSSSNARPSPSPQPPPSPKRRRREARGDWTPPLAVGALLGENLSRIEEAERLVLQWEAIIENARRTQPRADLSPFEQQLEEVRRDLEELEETEENLVPPDQLESTKQDRIIGRIEELREALETTESVDGKVNIQTAIDAYTDGRIQCWENWTLIYGGHIVDTCPSYGSFTVDRGPRLDRYFEQHGRGWLWFEPPLAPRGNIQPDQLMAATWAQPGARRSNIWGGENGWDITMGFRRVKTFHSREGEPKELVAGNVYETKDPVSDAPEKDSVVPEDGLSRKVLSYAPRGADAHKSDEQWEVRDDDEGLRCFFLMQLDSGASLPCLYEADLKVLGIDPQTYPPQTQILMSTAMGHTHSRLYELRIDVCKYNGQSLVGDDPVWPQERHELGGISPVAVINKSERPPVGSTGPLTLAEVKLLEAKGEDVSEETMAKRRKRSGELRLSGLLPFKCCYLGGAPGQSLWFGEDRRDVLGADRMPGQRRYEFFKQLKFEGLSFELGSVDRPKAITFEHQIGEKRIIDQDIEDHPGASLITVTDGVETEQHRLEPRKLSWQAKKSPKKPKRKRKDDFSDFFKKLVAKKRKHSQIESVKEER